ncbi:SUKH-4 family immunity protein [Streptomyces sp. NPDC101227]|uniref:SUKH-4 family immunity protein n=1 Tax=Streptomyces sp. NPDC101227 TaxID=3366136 RepID=UPI0037FC3A40
MPHEVTVEEAVTDVLSWWQDELTWEPSVVEIAGPPRSGRTAALRRLADDVTGAELLDATGLTAEELHAAVCELGEVDWSAAKEGEWTALGDRDEERKLIVIVNGHRAGRTRRSSHPRRITDLTLDDLAATGVLGIVIELDSDVSGELLPGQQRRRHLVAAPASGEAGAAEPDGAPVELHALALAELREVPVPVWQRLARSCGALDPTVEGLTALAREDARLEPLPSGLVRFRHEAEAERLRAALVRHERELVDRANGELLDWLSGEPTDPARPGSWSASGEVGGYAARALAMHAVNAGAFDRILEGEHAAHLTPDALLDAASCLPEPPPHDSVAADAFFAHLSGVTPADQGEWVAWLHLMATARGDAALARSLEGSGVRLPWKVRWADWRPPGGYQARYTEPGSVVSLGIVHRDGEPVVVGFGQFNRVFRIWRTADGVQVCPQGVEEFAPDVAESLSWPDGRTAPLTAQALRKASLSSALNGLDEDQFSCSARIDGLVVLGGAGGVVAVDPTDPVAPSAPLPLSPLRGQAEVWEYRQPSGPAPDPEAPLARALLDDLFGSAFTQRPDADRLPPGLTDPVARRVLTEIGLPPVDVLGLGLLPVADQGVQEYAWPADDAASGRQGPFFRIGDWWGGTVVIDGPSGQVLRSRAEGEPAEWSADPLVASDLERFLLMVHHFTVGAFMLSLCPHRIEGILLRNAIEGGLERLDPPGAASPAWMYQLRP